MPRCVYMTNFYLPTDDVEIPIIRDEWVAEGAECPSYQLLTAAEAREALKPSPFELSAEDAAIVTGAIVGVWCLAWAVRSVRKAL